MKKKFFRIEHEKTKVNVMIELRQQMWVVFRSLVFFLFLYFYDVSCFLNWNDDVSYDVSYVFFHSSNFLLEFYQLLVRLLFQFLMKVLLVQLP
jgi:hypothetical protein